MEQTQQLSPKETTLLKHLVSRGHKQEKKISFSMKSVCKDLELDDLEFLDTLFSLSLKGFIRILKLPFSEEAQVELRKRFLEVDMLSAVFGDAQLNERKDRIVKVLSAVEPRGSKLAETMSLQGLISISRDLDQLVQRLNEDKDLRPSDQDRSAQGHPPSTKSEEVLVRVQRKLDRCLREFWRGVELLKQESHELEGVPRITSVESLSAGSQEEIGTRQSEKRTAQMIALLLAIRAGAVSKNVATPELLEEFEELEARALIGEITPEIYKAKKNELEKLIEQSQLAFVSIGNIQRLVEHLQRRIELTNSLASAGLISEASRTKIVESASSDLARVEGALSRQLSDFYVSPSGDFSEKAPSTPYPRIG